MVVVNIDGAKITTWKAFHSYFKRTFGFPDFYGNNMNAWIDCMSTIDTPEHGMVTTNWVREGELLVLQLGNIEVLKRTSPDIYLALLEYSALINRDQMRQGKVSLIAISIKY
jgi:RNAse (barnase) inhibitor barstar